MYNLLEIIRLWYPQVQSADIEEVSIGLINGTWKITIENLEENERNCFILQRINTNVFRNFDSIDKNWKKLCSFRKDLISIFPPIIPALLPVSGDNDQTYVNTESGIFRAIQYIPGSISLTNVGSVTIAYEVAKQFGKFCASFAGLSPLDLEVTIPDFHNLPLRFAQLEESLDSGIEQRIVEENALISETLSFVEIVESYENLVSQDILQKRVTHHDTKISNVLINEISHEGMTVIDLDTVMPGYFISDLGDMFRTMLSPVDENCENLSQVEIRMDIFEAILRGYLVEVRHILTTRELQECVFAGKFVIYMQAIRFASDYLNGDRYYKTDYATHNLIRWKNQMDLLKKYVNKQEAMNQLLNSLIL
jgi:hypothetical protein